MIDAHFHIWELARGDYGWLTEDLGAIYRNFGLHDWRAARAGCGVDSGILVQAAASEDETQFLLRHARGAADVLGVVGWVDMQSPAAPVRIDALARDPKLKGLRPMLHDIVDPDWILQDALRPALHAIQDCDLTFDALVKPLHLGRIAQLALRFPKLRIVIDHAGKPDIAHGAWHNWADDVSRLAQLPGVFCKLSGLWTEAAPGSAGIVLAPYIDHILACFGPERTLWGSDWPVLELAAGYVDWHTTAHGRVAPPARGAVFDASARTAYRL